MRRCLARSTVVVLAAALGGCTAVSSAVVPSTRAPGQVFVTAGNIPEPHDIVGLLQVSKSGVFTLAARNPRRC